MSNVLCYRGVNAVHYLMFSDHLMVRRAATETLCNVSSNEALLKVQFIIEGLHIKYSYTSTILY